MSKLDAAKAAVAKVLLEYTGSCMCHEGYTSRRLIDPDCLQHNVPNDEAAEDILTVLMPLFATIWDDGNIAGIFDLPSSGHETPNPYRQPLSE